MTIASMEATLKLFLDPEKLTLNHPCYRMFSCGLEGLEKRAQKINKKLSAGAKDKADIHIVDGGSQVGSGSVPIETLPTKLLRVKPSSLSADNLAKKLRSNVPPIFTRVQKDSVLLDLRTIQPEEDESVQEALLRILKGKELSS
jgi:L-seryl-tRNA(Ser) seleniumtransferase